MMPLIFPLILMARFSHVTSYNSGIPPNVDLSHSYPTFHDQELPHGQLDLILSRPGVKRKILEKVGN